MRRIPGIVLLGLVGSLLLPAAAPGASKADSRRDLQGIWEARNTAAASLEAHSADAGIRAGFLTSPGRQPSAPGTSRTALPPIP